MNTLIVYGKNRKTGEVKRIFSALAPFTQCIRNAKKTADENGYDIQTVILNAFNRPYTDVTEQFMEGRIEE